MKNIQYNFLALVLLSLLALSCDNKTADYKHKGHSHDENEEVELKANRHDEHDGHEGHGEEEEHGEEVLLSQHQFNTLNMKIDTVSVRNIGDYIDVNGTLEVPPQNEAALTSVIGANVVSIKVIEGDKVNKGEVVAYLSHPNIIKMQTDYLNAYSNSEFLNKNYTRQRKLYDAGIGSGVNFQKAEAEYNVSKAMVKGLEAQLNLLNINATSVRKGTISQSIPLLSPIDGYVQKVEVKTGQYVEPQTELFEIIDTKHVHADFMVFEKDVYKVKSGQKITFNIPSIPNGEFTAKIYSVGKTFEDNPKAVHVHAEIENKKGTLIPGIYIKGRVQIESIKKIALPESALIKDGDKFYAFSVEKENKDWSFKPVEVILGIKDSNWVTVQFIDKPAKNTQFAYNNAYYLIAEMKKGETEHEH